MTVVALIPTYESIILNDLKNISTKVKALEHILDTLPARYTAIERSYNDPALDCFDLSQLCANLSEELQSPGSGIELDNWFSKILTSKKLLRDVAALENGIKDEEADQ